MQPRLNIRRMLVQWHDIAMPKCMRGNEILWQMFVVDMDLPYHRDAICRANSKHDRAV
jgi:hypothetical protein